MTNKKIRKRIRRDFLLNVERTVIYRIEKYGKIDEKSIEKICSVLSNHRHEFSFFQCDPFNYILEIQNRNTGNFYEVFSVPVHL